MPYSAKFAPPDGKLLLILGQDLDALGGLRSHCNGYTDHIPVIPGGLTTYTPLTTLSGLKTSANWGSGDVNAQWLMDEPKYQNSVLAIGLSLGERNVENVANGQHDAQIDELADWIQAQQRPIFLRIGYEFEGLWNQYTPEPYVIAFRRIVDRLRTLKVENFASVWQSATHHTPHYGGHDLMAWYPGDDYVDWFGMSYFEPRERILNEWLALARQHRKPIFIAESCPKGHNIAIQAAEEVWDIWFRPFFKFVYDNIDLIRVIAYINVNWDAQPMWVNGLWGDSRVEANPEFTKLWLDEIRKPVWLHALPNLFSMLKKA